MMIPTVQRRKRARTCRRESEGRRKQIRNIDLALIICNQGADRHNIIAPALKRGSGVVISLDRPKSGRHLSFRSQAN